ncbi:Apolipoprotein L3 [Dissostichus eleginoides]|uniref:Apolipoprotein L3 n=1 Tax=Dissostichus eleginoides TaxID=100907 RepID=A0AAD9C8V0_DISEL|nr:Apolipoprotein L3 [Dissostichus eleginoides]
MLQKAMCCYTADTLNYIDTVKAFCEQSSKWMLQRETEVNMMKDIQTSADKIDLSIGHVTQSQNKGKALEYMRSKVTQVTADSRRAELEEELAALLKSTLEGLEELDRFLDAVENLAVTSLNLFMEENQRRRRLLLPQTSECGSAGISAGQIHKDHENICEKLEKSSFCEFCPKMNDDTLIDLDVDLSEDDTQRMLHHINQLEELRMNQSFRMVFLFQEEEPCSDFINKFKERQPRIEQSLKDLEEHAVQLDRMNKGAKISSVAGSSVGAVGGVLSIVGLALIPVTAGVSLALTMTGVGMGITSGVNSAVTTATEIGVNRAYQNKAREVFESFVEDVQCLQDCLEEVTKREKIHIDVVLGVGKVLAKVGVTGKGIDALVDAASAFKLLKSEELALSAGKVAVQEGKALRSVPRVAADIPDIGQAAVKGPLALSKSARAGLIGLNAVFLGMESVSLAKGSETEVSQLIRARAALWRSEVDSMQTIHDLLCEGLKISEENKAILRRQFFQRGR